MSSPEVLDTAKDIDQANRVIAEIAAEADEPLAVDIDPDRTRETTRTGFSRMRTDWRAGDAEEVTGIVAQADGVIHRTFPGVYLLMNELWAMVRVPVADRDTGEVELDMYGWPVWEKLPSGAYAEDYSRLTSTEKDDFLLRITTLLVEWGQQSENLWLEAMLAKARWEEAMASGFTTPTGRMTVEERTQRGRSTASEDRYNAVFRASVSRKAERLVRDLERLGQRLKDSLTA